MLKFLGVATTLDPFLKADKASKMQGIFPIEWFAKPYKLSLPKLPLYGAFFKVN